MNLILDVLYYSYIRDDLTRINDDYQSKPQSRGPKR